MTHFKRLICFTSSVACVWTMALGAQSPAAPGAGAPPAGAPADVQPAADPNGGRQVVPPNYVIGADDILSVVFWRDQDMTREVVVRPDGKISLPVVNDLQAAGLTPDQLRLNITKAAAPLFTDEPVVSIVVKQINSRRVYITGNINKPGAYQLLTQMTVAQLIAMAGGLLEYADRQNISVVSLDKRPDGIPWRYKFNYAEFLRGINLKQNIELKPGDTVIVP